VDPGPVRLELPAEPDDLLVGALELPLGVLEFASQTAQLVGYAPATEGVRGASDDPVDRRTGYTVLAGDLREAAPGRGAGKEVPRDLELSNN
jgi:hypothetical protein